jgi:hypothetical protein
METRPSVTRQQDEARHLDCFLVDCEICAARDYAAQQRRAARAAAKGGCRCGQATCDCAEWDRIYREKFEDPEYYSRLTNRRAESPIRTLAALESQD